MKRQLLLPIAVFLSLFLSSVTWAYTIEDNTNVLKGLTNSSSTNGWVDVIPAGISSTYNIFGIDAGVSDGKLVLDIFTNFPESGATEGGLTTFPADLAIDVGDSLDGIFDYGVAFSTHDSVTKGQLYDVKTWYTSSSYFESITIPQYWYGEAWINPYTGSESPVVAMNETDTELGTTGLSWSGAGNDPDYKIHLEILLSALGIDPGQTKDIGLFLAAANCANDIVYGEIEVTNVPIPTAVLLLGSGLLGYVGIRRKYEKRT